VALAALPLAQQCRPLAQQCRGDVEELGVPVDHHVPPLYLGDELGGGDVVPIRELACTAGGPQRQDHHGWGGVVVGVLGGSGKVCLNIGGHDLGLSGGHAGLVGVDVRDITEGVDPVESDDLELGVTLR